MSVHFVQSVWNLSVGVHILPHGQVISVKILGMPKPSVHRLASQKIVKGELSLWRDPSLCCSKMWYCAGALESRYKISKMESLPYMTALRWIKNFICFCFLIKRNKIVHFYWQDSGELISNRTLRLDWVLGCCCCFVSQFPFFTCLCFYCITLWKVTGGRGWNTVAFIILAREQATNSSISALDIQYM